MARRKRLEQQDRDQTDSKRDRFGDDDFFDYDSDYGGHTRKHRDMARRKARHHTRQFQQPG